MSINLKTSSIKIPHHDNSLLHLKRFYTVKSGPPVFMLHGAIENGCIFYSSSDRGLAPYLARQGYDVFVADIRGHGKSTPTIDSQANYGQTDTIIAEIPAFINKIIEIKGSCPQYWVAHSWGGVLLNAFLSRFPQYQDQVVAAVYFATKRRVRVWNLHRILIISLVWNNLCRVIARLYGFVPAKFLRIGADNETNKFHLGCKYWIKEDEWRDPEDDFDYGKAIRSMNLPPILYFAASNDKCLGHPEDVKRFMQESGEENAKYRLLGKAYGNLHNYDHINLLTHPDAQTDHFPEVLKWFKRHSDN